MTQPSPSPGAPEPLLQLAVMFVAVAVALSASFYAAIAVVVAGGVFWAPQVPYRPLRPGQVLRCYLPFAAVWLVLTVGYLHGMHALGHPILPQGNLVELARQGAAHPRFVSLVLLIVVLAPVCEELFFRGYLFTAVRGVLPNWPAQIVTAAAFGAVHGVDYALPIAVLSLLFGWLRERTGALLPSMLAHAVHNALTVAVTVLWPQHLQWMYPQ